MVPVLEIRHLWKSYPGFTLRDVSLTLKRGTVTALLGRNGAGKTTLIKCALGVIPRDRGSIRFQGVEREYGEVAWRRSVGYVAESHPLYDWMRVEQFLRFIAAHYPTWDDAYCQQLLERFRLDPHKQIRELSHGMRVGLALIAALAWKDLPPHSSSASHRHSQRTHDSDSRNYQTGFAFLTHPSRTRKTHIR